MLDEFREGEQVIITGTYWEKDKEHIGELGWFRGSTISKHKGVDLGYKYIVITHCVKATPLLKALT